MTTRRRWFARLWAWLQRRKPTPHRTLDALERDGTWRRLDPDDDWSRPAGPRRSSRWTDREIERGYRIDRDVRW